MAGNHHITPTRRSGAVNVKAGAKPTKRSKGSVGGSKTLGGEDRGSKVQGRGSKGVGLRASIKVGRSSVQVPVERGSILDTALGPKKFYKPAVTMPDELNVREAKAVQGLLEGKSAHQALKDAGYSKATAEHQAASVLGKPRVQSAMLKMMDEMGISESMLVQTLKRGLKAKRSFITRYGDEIKTKDFSVRHKYLQTALELRGDLKRKDEADEGSWEEMIFQVRARRTLPR